MQFAKYIVLSNFCGLEDIVSYQICPVKSSFQIMLNYLYN